MGWKESHKKNLPKWKPNEKDQANERQKSKKSDWLIL
jgi:hypothetical protein